MAKRISCAIALYGEMRRMGTGAAIQANRVTLRTQLAIRPAVRGA